MDKIIFICESSSLSTDIREQLEKSFKVESSGFDLDKVKNSINELNPLMVVAFVKKLSSESGGVLKLLLSSQIVEFVLIGNPLECHDFLGLGNIRKCIIDPVGPQEVLIQVEDVSDEIAERPKRFRSKDMDVKKETKKDTDTKTETKSEKKHILVVDDDIVALRTVTNYIKDKYQVSVVKSGTAAISFLAKEKPDLILLDYEMPVCNGLQTLQMIRGEEEYKDIPVFFLTGVSDAGLVRAAVDLKPEGYILKSTTQTELISKINFFFRKQAAEK